MKGKGCLASLGGLILVGVAIWGGWHLYAYIRYAPKVNPHPKYFMTIKGHIDRKLGKLLTIRWTATYYSTNPACNIWGGAWNEGGVKRPREKKISFNIKLNSSDQYKVSTPIDKYLPGFCRWQLGSMFYDYSYKGAVRRADANTAVGFSATKTPWTQPIIQDWLCGQNKCSLSKQSTIYVSSDLSLYKNYDYTLNFQENIND